MMENKMGLLFPTNAMSWLCRHGIDLDNPGPSPNNGTVESSLSVGGYSDSGESTGARSADNATPPMHFLTPHVEISMTEMPPASSYSPPQVHYLI